MNAVSALPAIVVMTAAIGTAMLLAKRFGSPPAQGRFSSIDGLRGYLAFFVFIHHSCVWYFYLQTGEWKLPPSNLYIHFGQSAVALFFMITGFLFFSKLIDGRKKNIDWTRLYVSRFLRLAPLYFFMTFLLFIVVAILSHGILIEPGIALSKEIIHWLGLGLLGMPQLNGVSDTPKIIAWVTWSLFYEWLFYLSLPLLALTIRVKPPRAFIALAIVSGLYLEIWNFQIYYLAFLGGIIASFLVRSNQFRNFAVRGKSSFIIIGCLAAVVTLFSTAYGIFPIFFLAAAFALIASGNDLFGLLATSTSRTLGELAYSIYLLHGIALFTIFAFVLGMPLSRELSPLTYWFVILTITPVLICLCFLTFKYIEHPAMQMTPKVTKWIRSNIIHHLKRSTSTDSA